MLKAALAAMALILTACGGGGASGPTPVVPTPTPDTRVTDTFLVRVVVYPDGGVGYYGPIPAVRVQRQGPVQVSTVFQSPVDCSFQLCVCHGGCTSCVLKSPQGRGPNLYASGTLDAGNYLILLNARNEGVSLCRSVPDDSPPFDFNVVVLHP